MKRCIDIFASVIGLIILTPVILVISCIIFLRMGRPIFFRQDRPGRNGDIFKMYKFRTMTMEVDANGQLLPDSIRLGKLGRFLRASSLDELPELYNVLKGDMSLVGPRPLSVLYLPYYTPEEFRRHSVRPGITGLAQVSGRNTLSWESKFRLDLEYVDNQSLWLDIKILFLTLYKVFRSDGIGQGDERPLNFHETRTQKYR